MTRSYVFKVYYQWPKKGPDDIGHAELGEYNLEAAPWVPPVGSYFRFRDPCPPSREPDQYDHREFAGKVGEVVTVFYGTRTVIEVYLTEVKIH